MAVIEKRKIADGTLTYRVKIRIKGHRQKSATFERLSEARDWAQQEEADIKRGLKFDDYEASTKTLSQVIDLYLKNLKAQVKPYHYVQRERHLKWWKTRLGPNFLIDVTPKKINEYKRELMERIRENTTKGGKAEGRCIQPATVNHYLIALSAVLSYAHKELNWIRYNPMSMIQKLEIDNARIRFLNTDELKALLTACKDKERHPYLYPVVLLALSTGLRKGEIMNLCWQDLDFKKKILFVMQSKNGDKRAVPLTGSELLSLLKALHQKRKSDAELVFVRSDGLAPFELKKHWEAAIKASKLSDFHFHDLRHTAATYLLQSGATLPELSGILGHRTIQMVKRYAHLADNHAIEVAEKMTKKVFG